MKNFSFAAVRLCLAMVSLAVVFSTEAAPAEVPLKGEVLLVWGTDAPQSPDPTHIPVDPELAKKLSKSPYRWKYYFQVKQQLVEIPVGETKKNVSMSKHCALDIKNLGNNRVEVKLYGEGKLVSTNKEPWMDNWPLIFAGASVDETAWLVVLRKTGPTPVKPVTTAK